MKRFFLLPCSLLLAMSMNSCGPASESDPGDGEAEDSAASEQPAEPHQAYIGLSLEDAEALADKNELPHRVVSVDGKPNAVTADFLPNRLNFDVEGGKVVKVTTG